MTTPNDASMIYTSQLRQQNATLKAVIKACVLQMNGELILSEEKLGEADLKALDITKDDSGNYYFRVYEGM